MFSRSCQYAIQAVLFVAYHQVENQLVGLKQISESQEIPSHFLSKIMQQLVRHQILESVKGPNGGFRLAIPMDEIRLIKIVEIMDGLQLFDRCAIGFKECSDDNPCPVHDEYKIIKNRIRNLLTDKSLTELVQDVKDGKSIVTLKI